MRPPQNRSALFLLIQGRDSAGTAFRSILIIFAWRLKALNFQARFIGLAAEINGMMPSVVTSMGGEGLNRSSKSIRSSKVLVLGVAYKKNVSDCRESPALDIMRMLTGKGAHVSYNDPFVPRS
jgi:UDP-N-acetyl-D-glucosamine dehydrogenase